jgi:glycosyltransferase involved in cell wall biosynthesis
MTPGQVPRLSVVLACVDAASSIDRALEAVQQSSGGIQTEILVVDASTDGTADRVAAAWPHVRLIRVAPGVLVPTLWGVGLRAAGGDTVAFSIGHCVVDPGWAHALLAAEGDGIAGVGGPIRLLAHASAVDAAILFIRYSAFLGPASGPRSTVREIAGDNAAYPAAVLRRHAALFADGFWETELHHELRGEHLSLCWAPDAGAAFGHAGPAAAFARQRFHHGKRFGTWRVAEAGLSRWRVCLAAPLVPLVMLGRILPRIWPIVGYRRRLVAAAPHLARFLVAWAAGEAAGAWEARPKA